MQKVCFENLLHLSNMKALKTLLFASFFRNIYITSAMCVLPLALTVDPALGHVDLRTFSDQILMEMYIDGFDDDAKERHQDADGMYREVCGWSIVNCDADARVTEIWHESDVRGSLQLRFIPPKLKIMYLDQTKMGGTLDLTQLPEPMQSLQLTSNAFTGELDLTKLPRKMEELDLRYNAFTGEVDLSKLPEAIVELYLGNNQLSGTVDFTHLPERMQYIVLDHNQFTGSLIARNLPAGMQSLSVAWNAFSAIALVDEQTEAVLYLGESGVKSIIDENGNESDIRVVW